MNATLDDHGNLHDKGGRFAKKNHTAPTGELSDDPEARSREFRLMVLESPDPEGGYDTVVNAPTGTYFLRGDDQHRVDGPSYEGRDGSVEYRRDGRLHREDGPAVVIEPEGIEQEWVNGELVRG